MKALRKGEQAHVTAHGLTLEGEGVAQLEERTLLCPGLFPTEEAQVRVEAVSRQHARVHASLLHVERAHPQRRVAPCPNHVGRGGQCSGCALMELDEAAQRSEKRALLAAQFGLSVERVEAAGEPLGYRWSSKRVALGRAGACVLGSYVRHSHQPARMTGCLVEHPLLRAAFDATEQLLAARAIEPFDEASGDGDLRYVWGKTNGEQVILTLVTAHSESRAAQELPEALLPDAAAPAALSNIVVGISHSVQPARGNAMRGHEPQLLRGIGELSGSLLGQTVALGALGFLQPNPAVAEQAYLALTALGEGSERRALAFDLYAGAGVTTRHLRRSFEQVVACEAYPESAHALGSAPQDTADFLRQQLARESSRPDLVIANPPRKGMGAEVCQLLLALGAPELRIMSCGPAALARDLALLSTGYELISLRAFDTLPQTPHVELVACLMRR